MNCKQQLKITSLTKLFQALQQHQAHLLIPVFRLQARGYSSGAQLLTYYQTSIIKKKHGNSLPILKKR
jgi:hypothetical protein